MSVRQVHSTGKVFIVILNAFMAGSVMLNVMVHPRHHDTQHNDSQHNGIRHNDT
jgi:hypothetical protein